MRRPGKGTLCSALAFGAALSLGAPSADAAEGADAARAPEAPAPLELGLFGGVFFPSRSHELLTRGPYQPYSRAAPELGARLGFFPLRELGLELEGAAMPSETLRGDPAGLWAFRAQAAFRVRRGRFVAFSVVGVGLLGGASNELGSDSDPAVHLGLGGAFALDDLLSLRLDLRDTLTQKYARSAGVQTHHPEILLGLSFGMRPETSAAKRHEATR